VHATFTTQAGKLCTSPVRYKSSSEEGSRERHGSVVGVSVLGLAF
jgi:hypothetical protein